MDDRHRRAGEPSAPPHCRTGVCPAEGFLETFLGTGGCVFCRAGRCSATPQTISLFATREASRRPIARGGAGSLPRR